MIGVNGDADGSQLAVSRKRKTLSATASVRKIKNQSRKIPTLKQLTSFGSLASHPYGVKPMGNLYFSDSNTPKSIRSTGLGYFSLLDDAFILNILSDSELIPTSLLFRLTCCSKAFYVLCSQSDIWRLRTLAEFQGNFGPFEDSWKNTYKRCLARERSRAAWLLATEGANEMFDEDQVPEGFLPDVPIKVEGFYSDYLFSSWRCSSIPLDKLCRTNAPETIDRQSNLSYEDFVKEYAVPNKPVIITDIVPQWPAFSKWTNEFLLSQYSDVKFRAEAVELTLKTYASYSARCNLNGGAFEESPLYLFDKHFGTRTKMAEDYTVPSYFSEDLLSVLGESRRPDYKWLIIGPARSGSTFHLDPNSTSAWNAVIRGSKKWIMFPPEVVPPGVFPSEDGSEVTTPVSLSEWFLNHYDEMRNWPVKPVECICKEGEIIFVPRGWWHAVMNLEETIAITQNFVSSENIKHVLRFLDTKRDQVSGFGMIGCGDLTQCLENDDDDVEDGEGSAPAKPKYGMHLYEEFVEALGDKWTSVVQEEKAEREAQSHAAKKLKDAKNGAMMGSLFQKSRESETPEENSAGFKFSFF
ncbi:hypothetical protein HDV05_007711 [Chytridiales sp. JEL 0842]|nr:hypothetical protein HDV05_007711 [Chytridiales sp. JEL 0842]